MTTNYCPECVINWLPFMAARGECPSCGGGTYRRQEPATERIQILFDLAKIERTRRESYVKFEEYYAEREAARGPDGWQLTA